MLALVAQAIGELERPQWRIQAEEQALSVYNEYEQVFRATPRFLPFFNLNRHGL